MSNDRKHSPLHKQVDAKPKKANRGVDAGCLLIAASIIGVLVALVAAMPK